MTTSSSSGKLFLSGVLIALLGAICFSTKAILVKLAYRDTVVDAISLLALRMIFSLPFFMISAYASSSKQTNVKFTTHQWISVAVIGCLGYYISSLLDFLGLQYVTAGIERLILFVYPTLLLLMSSFSVKLFWASITELRQHHPSTFLHLCLLSLSFCIRFAITIRILM